MNSDRKIEDRLSGLKPVIIAIFVSLILILSFFAIIFGDPDRIDEKEGMEEGIIYPGIGIKTVRIGDPIGIVYDEFGDPVNEIETGETIWLNYRDPHGIDFLISNYTNRVLEIRFQEGYAGELKGGVSIGDTLEDGFDAVSNPEEIRDTNYSQTHESVYGGDRILYRQIGEGGNITAYKYIDQENGVVFWADESESITQIVVFDPIHN
mgnify:FL=1